MTTIAELGRRVGEALRTGDTLAVAQLLSDARKSGGRPAVLGVLDAACTWLGRAGPSPSQGGVAPRPLDSTTAARSRHTDVSGVRGEA